MGCSKMSDILLKMTCITPPGKAVKCEESWRKQFLIVKKPIKTIIVNDSKFLWYYKCKDEKERDYLHKKAILVEGGVKSAYGAIIPVAKLIRRCKKRMGWATERALKWMMGRNLHKDVDLKKLKDLDDVSDIEDMQQFLRKELIHVELVDEVPKELEVK